MMLVAFNDINKHDLFGIFKGVPNRNALFMNAEDTKVSLHFGGIFDNVFFSLSLPAT